MTCALCGSEAPLIESHIIPEFLHRSVYDEHHRTRLFTHKSDESRLLQKGVRDRLLCGACEQKFSVLERYFSQLWYHSSQVPERIDGDELVLTSVDCAKIKLLVLSIVWRASVSSRPEFDGASLGTTHERNLHDMLVRADPGPMAAYPLIAAVIVDSRTRELWDRVILAPTKMKALHEHWAHTMAFAGICWTLITSSHYENEQHPHLMSLHDDGRFRLGVISERKYAEITGLAEDARRAMRGRPS
jgi:hypothetical protein